MVNVMILEDNLDLRNALRTAVEIDGHTVVTGGSGRDGLRALRSGNPPLHVIICDLRMPDIDGFTFLDEVRANPNWDGMFIIAVSGDQADRSVALAKGANIYLAKPFNLVTLNHIIAEQFPPT